MPSILPARLTIATRESRLALWQAHYVKDRLAEIHPALEVEILGVSTLGDRILDRTLNRIGGKGLFVKELEIAMQDGRADLAVHSAKDIPMTLPEGFALVIVGERGDARDALVSNQYARLADLPGGSVVGTSSLRRESQIRERYPDLQVAAVRGNVDTRLRKLDEGQYAALILAAAGLKRLGLGNRITTLLGFGESLPAAGQGALGIEFRAARLDLGALLAPLTDPATSACVEAERALSRRLGGNCDVPLAAHAHIDSGRLVLHAMVAAVDGRSVLRTSAEGNPGDGEQIAIEVAAKLLAMGADRILALIQGRSG